MRIRICDETDVPLLAAMNKRLIEDEKSSNPMDIEQLENRMRVFLSGEYTAYLFTEDGSVAGYALVKDSSTPYLRQFYIERQYRRAHRGRNAFELLKEQLQTDAIDIDVLPWNQAGRAFWASLGFKETCVSMRYERE